MPDFINEGVINYMKKYCTWLLVLLITDDFSAYSSFTGSETGQGKTPDNGYA